MQTGLIILIVALVVVTVAGPAIGYHVARLRFQARERERSEADQRIRELEGELRRLRTPSPTVQTSIASEISRIRAELEVRDREIEALRRSARPLAQLATQDPVSPASATTSAARKGPEAETPAYTNLNATFGTSGDQTGRASSRPAAASRHPGGNRPSESDGPRRFDLEPPLFEGESGPDLPDPAPGRSAGESGSRSGELPVLSVTPPRSAPAAAASLTGAMSGDSASAASSAVQKGGAPATPNNALDAPTASRVRSGNDSAGGPSPPTGSPATSSSTASSPAASSPAPSKADSKPAPSLKPEFKSVGKLIDAGDAAELSWLPDVTAGRRLKLRQLGYDDPIKLARLKTTEIRRLARALDVTEDEIRTRWMPVAQKLSAD